MRVMRFLLVFLAAGVLLLALQASRDRSTVVGGTKNGLEK